MVEERLNIEFDVQDDCKQYGRWKSSEGEKCRKKLRRRRYQEIELIALGRFQENDLKRIESMLSRSEGQKNGTEHFQRSRDLELIIVTSFRHGGTITARNPIRHRLLMRFCSISRHSFDFLLQRLSIFSNRDQVEQSLLVFSVHHLIHDVGVFISLRQDNEEWQHFSVSCDLLVACIKGLSRFSYLIGSSYFWFISFTLTQKDILQSFVSVENSRRHLSMQSCKSMVFG